MRPTTITMSRPSTLHKSPWTSKVSSLLYLSPIPHPSNGILLEHLSLCYARYHMTSTTIREDAEEAKESRPSKAYAWKRRRKRQDEDEEEVGKTAWPASSPDWPVPRPAGVQKQPVARPVWPVPSPASRPASSPVGPAPRPGTQFSHVLHPFCTKTINRSSPPLREKRLV